MHSLPVTLTISAAFFSYLWKTLPQTTAFAVFFAQKYGYFKQNIDVILSAVPYIAKVPELCILAKTLTRNHPYEEERGKEHHYPR